MPLLGTIPCFHLPTCSFSTRQTSTRAGRSLNLVPSLYAANHGFASTVILRSLRRLDGDSASPNKVRDGIPSLDGPLGLDLPAVQTDCLAGLDVDFCFENGREDV